jgi:hypothetical protein
MPLGMKYFVRIMKIRICVFVELYMFFFEDVNKKDISLQAKNNKSSLALSNTKILL